MKRSISKEHLTAFLRNAGIQNSEVAHIVNSIVTAETFGQMDKRLSGGDDRKVFAELRGLTTAFVALKNAGIEILPHKETE
jgi:hypothetical protein